MNLTKQSVLLIPGRKSLLVVSELILKETKTLTRFVFYFLVRLYIDVQVPYARSEVFLTETLEDICEKYKKYTQAIHPVTGKLTYAFEEFVIQHKRIGGKNGKLFDAVSVQ